MQRQAQHGIDMYVQKNIETATTTTKAQKRTKVVPPVNLKIMTDYGAEREMIYFFQYGLEDAAVYKMCFYFLWKKHKK